jgi:aspartyl-tRNA(Asn)/glutamyl-tRNA(Gln) amidotransferase subunit C
MELTVEEVQHLAKLCKLEVEDEAAERYAKQLSEVLEYVGKLREVEVDIESEAVASVTGLENVMREDELHGCTAEERERILDQFPLREDDLLKTRGVFGI